ncbi:hypothetical protein RIF29_34338 [Crotalaria pallida]|uniref:RBR-type E3 ubiquitin transferase n=1 Tax=Crotalaria pallida TaxID=3830 RepID=A0AAN9EB18_CROPI
MTKLMNMMKMKSFSIMDNVEEKVKDDAEKFKITPTSNFNILSEYGISRLQEADITNVSIVLSISRVTACLLPMHFDWSVTKVHEAWFDCEKKVRKAVGLIKEPQVCFLDFKILDCDICFESFTCNMMKSLGCGHPYCINYWKDFIDTKINEGPDKCLALKCPHPSCTAAVDGDMIHQFASEPNRNKYDMFLLRSYVKKNKNMKWCPGPDCEFSIVFQPNDVNKKLDVACLCQYSFCWNCGEDAHSPVDCETVVESRRLLKWAYVYGYYLPENEKAKIEFFEYTQGEAVAVFERFHHYLETKLHKFLTGEALDQFEDFYLKLIEMTVTTRNYFDNLVRALENGLADVEARSYSGIKRRFSEM